MCFHYLFVNLIDNKFGVLYTMTFRLSMFLLTEKYQK